MVNKAYKKWKKGRKVYANFPLYFSETNERVYEYEHLSEIYHVKNAIILMDEAQTMIDSYAWQTLPKYFYYKITQNRKHGLDFYAPVQNMGAVHIRFRQLIHEWRHCQKIIRFPFNDNKLAWIQIYISNKILTNEKDNADKEIYRKKKLRIHLIHGRQPVLYDTHGSVALERFTCKAIFKNSKMKCVIKTKT